LANENFYLNNAFYKTVGTERIVWGINPDPRINAEYTHDIMDEISALKSQPNSRGSVAFEGKIVSGRQCCRRTQVFINLEDNPSYL
jgi:hypothetical protein